MHAAIHIHSNHIALNVDGVLSQQVVSGNTQAEIFLLLLCSKLARDFIQSFFLDFMFRNLEICVRFHGRLV